MGRLHTRPEASGGIGSSTEMAYRRLACCSAASVQETKCSKRRFRPRKSSTEEIYRIDPDSYRDGLNFWIHLLFQDKRWKGNVQHLAAIDLKKKSLAHAIIFLEDNNIISMRNHHILSFRAQLRGAKPNSRHTNNLSAW